MKPTNPRCSFCGKVITEPVIVIWGPTINKHRAYICEACVAICAYGIKDFRNKEKGKKK